MMDFKQFAVDNMRDEFRLPQMPAQQRERLRDGAEPNVPTICAWCPGFDPKDPANAGKSHGMCAACAVKFEAGR